MPELLDADDLAVTAQDQDKMDKQANADNSKAQEEDYEFWTSHTATFEWEVENLEIEHSVTCDRKTLCNTLRTPLLDAGSAAELGCIYAQMGTYGRVTIARQKVARECERLMALMMGAITEERLLEEEVRALDRKDALREEARRAVHAKIHLNQ